MSKEQTPITAEEFYEKSQYKGERFGNSIEIDETDLTDLMEQYAQAKVLEALERVRTELTEKTYTDGFVTSNAFEVVDEEIKKQK